MKEKVRDFVYLNTSNYISLESLKAFYWGIIIIPFIMVALGIFNKSVFPIIAISVWSLLWWIFVLVIQSKHTKKKFELRFLVNGITGVFISTLFWVLFASFGFVFETSFWAFDFFLWLLLFYLFFSSIYVAAIAICVHKGLFKLIKEKSSTRTASILSLFFGVFLSVAGASGMYMSRLMQLSTNAKTQYIVIAVVSIFLIFVPSLAHINFLQYFYCKKYEILCDEYGNFTSTNLERRPKKIKTNKKCVKQSDKRRTKKLPLILKILIGIGCAPVAALVLLMFIGFLISLCK